MNSIQSYGEKLKLERLFDTFHSNFRLTQLYAAYLERFPEIITKDMIDSVTEGGLITAEDAIAAILSELFALDTEKDEDDRRFFRNYVLPSVRILTAERYTSNPYYKNIKLPDVKRGSWEFKNESYKPYRAVICHDMIINEDFSEIAPLGFFEEEFHFPAVLEDGNEWMTLTPVDLDTCDDAIAAAHGRVITFGLGLGYYAYMVSLKDNVESVTVVEKSEKVIELFREFILPQFSKPEKVRIICADAFEYAEHTMPDEHFDYAFVDTWRDASDGAPMYKRMKPLETLNPDTEFSYWIENFLISNIRAEKLVGIREKYNSGELELSYDEIVKELKK
ncbi:MAG: hypothetical protein IJD79_03125 [Clostridia bacterium]|nr:hypothetical protein [Clostridia bacterium]